jgi:hypothetical protein
LAHEDAVLTYAESGETKTQSEWATHARAISNQMWQRFQESGEDAEGELKDESWTLVGWRVSLLIRGRFYGGFPSTAR